MTTGGLTALNKIAAAENEARITRGEKPEVRPVNGGVYLLKTVLKAAAASTSGVRVTKSLAPTACGIGMPGGPAVVAMMARMANKINWSISKEDAKNGFNALARQALFDAVGDVWPEAARIFNTFYGMASPVLYRYQLADGTSAISVMWSMEGTRMGCVLGSLGFNITIQKRLYGPLGEEYPNNPTCALTDDRISAIPTPQQGASLADWDDFYDNHAEMLEAYMKYGADVGIHRSESKSTLLVPQHAMMPTNDTRRNGIKINVAKRAMMVAGAPIGPDEDVIRGVEERIAAIVKPTCDGVIRLAQTQPQIALRVLTDSVNSALDYTVATVPTHLIAAQILQFDELIMHTLFKCLEPDGAVISPASPERNARARNLAALPVRNGGLGLTPLANKAPAAFLSTIFAASAHPITAGLVSTFKDEIGSAYNMVCGQVRQPYIAQGHPLAAVLPTKPDDIVDRSFFDSHISLTNKPRIQKAIVDMTLAVAWKDLRDQCVTLARGDDTSQSDATHILAATSRSQASRLFRVDLADDRCAVSGQLFTTWTRWWLGLPQIIRRSNTMCVGIDYVADVCNWNGHNVTQVVDLAGNHAAGCATATGERTRAHDGVVRTILEMAQEAGLVTKREVPVHTCLRGMTQRQAALSFPDLSTQSLKSKHTEIHRLQVAVQTGQMDGRTVNDAEKMLLRVNIDILVDEVLQEAKSLRIDGEISDLEGKLTIWIDATLAHITCGRDRNKSLQFLLDERDGMETAILESGSARSMQNNRVSITPVIEKKGQEKCAKYERPRLVAADEHRRGERCSTPHFRACVMSHRGEMGPGMFNVIEMITQFHKARIAALGKLSWETPREAAARFRNKVKNRLATSLARGWARQMMTAGETSLLLRRSRNGGCRVARGRGGAPSSVSSS